MDISLFSKDGFFSQFEKKFYFDIINKKDNKTKNKLLKIYQKKLNELMTIWSSDVVYSYLELFNYSSLNLSSNLELENIRKLIPKVESNHFAHAEDIIKCDCLEIRQLFSEELKKQLTENTNLNKYQKFKNKLIKAAESYADVSPPKSEPFINIFNNAVDKIIAIDKNTTELAKIINSEEKDIIKANEIIKQLLDAANFLDGVEGDENRTRTIDKSIIDNIKKLLVAPYTNELNNIDNLEQLSDYFNNEIAVSLVLKERTQTSEEKNITEKVKQHKASAWDFVAKRLENSFNPDYERLKKSTEVYESLTPEQKR